MCFFASRVYPVPKELGKIGAISGQEFQRRILSARIGTSFGEVGYIGAR